MAMSLSAMAASKVLVHGHRGARAVRPENTIPAFEYAIAAGVDVLELDLAVTKDNVLVVSHDPEINPFICMGGHTRVPIRQLTLDEVKKIDCGTVKNIAFPKQQPVPGAKIPTLDEVLALGKRGQFEFNIETKIFANRPEVTPSPEVFVKLFYDAVKRSGMEKRVILQSFDFRTLHAMKVLDPTIRLSALYEGKPKNFVDIAKEAGAQIVSPYYKLVTKEQVAAAHKAGLQVVPWTANKPEEWQQLIDCGVDAIISDDPAELISFLKKQPPPSR